MSGMNLEFEVIFSPKAIKQLKHLEKDVQLRIKSAIENRLRSFTPGRHHQTGRLQGEVQAASRRLVG